MEDALLSARFLLYPKTIEAEVTLTCSSITIKNLVSKKKTDDVISLNDVIGCHILEGNKTTSVSWYLCIFSYPFKNKPLKGLSRQKVSRSLGIFLPEGSNAQKKLTAERWKNAIMHLINRKKLQKDEVSNLTTPVARKLIVYVNPFSGSGKAMKIYEKYVKPMFAEAEIQHQLVKTEYAGHAREIARELLVDKYDGIVIVSGDGLVHEVLNGLMDRPDWESCIKTPLGVVPGGSGNALVASILYACNGCHPPQSSITSSIFTICRGSTVKLDLMSTETPGQDGKPEVLYSLLGCVIGLIADIDIESEHLRFMGQGFRTNVYAVMRIASLRNYKVTVSYLPTDKSKDEQPNSSDSAISSISASSSSSSANTESSSISNHHLVPLHQQVPPHWKTIEDEFIQVSGLNISHLSEDVTLHPSLDLNDGQLMLTLLKSSVNRRNLLKYWDLLEKGIGLSDVNSDHAQLIPCKAFRIEPHTKHSEIITLDGEVLPFGPFQCQVHPGLARVFGREE